MSLVFQTTIPVIDPAGCKIEIKIEIDAPEKVKDEEWSTAARVEGVPHGTGFYIRDNPLTSLCYALNFIRRFIQEEMKNGYTAECMLIHEHIEEYFDWPESLKDCQWFEGHKDDFS